MGAALDPLTASLRGWTPVHVAVGQSRIDWAMLRDPPAHAFFEHDADIAMRRPFNALFARRTPIDVLDAFAAQPNAAAPAGFLFHMSRAGSTLIARMLAQIPSVIVLPEPQPFDGVLRRYARDPSDVDAAVRALRGLAQAFADGERRIVVKLHAWHVLALPLLRRAFPGVPWAFAAREPRAVLRSQQREPGPEVIAGTIPPAALGTAALPQAASVAAVPGERDAADYRARVIAAFCTAALRHADDPRAVFVDYEQLPAAVAWRIAPVFGVDVAPNDRERMDAIALRDAKRDDPFVNTNDPVSEAIENDARRWLDEPYAALRALAYGTSS